VTLVTRKNKAVKLRHTYDEPATERDGVTRAAKSSEAEEASAVSASEEYRGTGSSLS
jgi:hypothetical protein